MSKKGSEKNTKAKAKHAKLIAQKRNKQKQEATKRKERLKAIIKKSK